MVLLSLTQGHVNIWEWQYGQQITMNTLQIAVACGRGTMTGLCFFQLASAILLLLSAVCFRVSGHHKPLPTVLTMGQLYHQFGSAQRSCTLLEEPWL